MTNPIRQHFVPKTYLKNFAFKKNNSYKLFAFSKDNNNTFEANIDDVAVEKNFYTIGKGKDKYSWENFYAKQVEPIMGVELNKLITLCDNLLINNYADIIDNKMKEQLSLIIIFQLFRGNHTRKLLDKRYYDAEKEIVEKAKMKFGESSIERVAEYFDRGDNSETFFKYISASVISDVKKMQYYSSFLFDKCWRVFKLTGESEYITSDSPILLMNLSNLDVTPFRNGLISEQTTIFFPITPKIMIVICAKDNVFFGELHNSDGKLIKLNDSDCNKIFVEIMNNKQLEQCTRQVYSKSKKILNIFQKN